MRLIWLLVPTVLACPLVGDASNLAPQVAWKSDHSDSAAQSDTVSAAERSRPSEVANQNQQRQLDEKLKEIANLILGGSTGRALIALQGVPGIEEMQDSRRLRSIMRYAVAANDLNLIKWLNNHCTDCAINKLGSSLIRDMGSSVNSRGWRAMNAQTFKYVYEQGGVQHFLDNDSGKSIVPTIAGYWIPEGDSVYSDYTVSAVDKAAEARRHADRRDMLSFLLAEGYDVNEVSTIDNQTALFKAFLGQDRDLIDFLLQYGADPLIGHNPMATVSAYTEPSLLAQLLELELSPNTVTPRVFSGPTTLLGRLVQSGQYRPGLLAILEEHGLDVNVVDSDGKTAMDYAGAEAGQAQTPYTDYLLAQGARPSVGYYYAALKAAMRQREHAQLAEILATHPQLANGHKPDERMKPLNFAVAYQDPTALEMLLEARAQLHDENNFSLDLLTSALSQADFDMASILLEKRPDIPVNYQDNVDGKTLQWSLPLMEASAHGNLEWVQRLLERGAVTSGTQLGTHPIYGAALNGHVDVVKALLDAGSPANPADPQSGDRLIQLLSEYSDDDDRIAEIAKLLSDYAQNQR